MGKMERQKGAVGEREFAKWLRENLDESAARGVQFQGSADSPDVTSKLPIHFEVKRTERFNVYTALEQCIGDCHPDKVPIVAHRRNSKPWVVMMRADDFAVLIKQMEAHTDGKRLADMDLVRTTSPDDIPW